MTYCRRCADPNLDCDEHRVIAKTKKKSLARIISKWSARAEKILSEADAIAGDDLLNAPLQEFVKASKLYREGGTICELLKDLRECETVK